MYIDGKPFFLQWQRPAVQDVMRHIYHLPLLMGEESDDLLLTAFARQ